MGVTWSQPKPNKDATKIIIKATFPKQQTLKAQIWNLWKHYKQSLKHDGFAISRFNNQWYIYYFAEIDELSNEKQKTTEGMMPNYMIIFKQKYLYWKETLDELNSIEHLRNSSEPEEDSWYFDMENDKDI